MNTSRRHFHSDLPLRFTRGEGRGEVFAFIGDPEFKALAKEIEINWLK